MKKFRIFNVKNIFYVKPFINRFSKIHTTNDTIDTTDTSETNSNCDTEPLTDYGSVLEDISDMKIHN